MKKKTKKIALILTAMLCGWQTMLAQPGTPAPTPSREASDVKVMFSDAYSEKFGKFQIDYDDWNSDKFLAEKTIITPFGTADEVLKIEGLSTGSLQHNAQISLGTCNLSDMEYIHMDVYSPSENGIGEFSFYLISGWSKTVSCNVWYNFDTKQEYDQWISLDVPLSTLKNGGLDLTNINVLRIVRGKQGAPGTVVYVDNVYAYGKIDIPEPEPEPGIVANGNANLTTDVPLIAAPVPKVAAANVFNFFSEHYGDGKFDYTQSDYGDQKTVKSLITIEGTDDQVFKIEDIVNGSKANVSIGSPNLSGMDMLHMDIFSPGNDQGIGEFDFALTDFGGNGNDAGIWLNITEKGWHGQWISIDLPLSKWTGATNMIRFRRGGKGSAGRLLYVDNVYAYKSGGEDPGPDPEPIPDPTTVPVLSRDKADVTSIFCEQYEEEGYQEELGIVSAGNWGQNANQKDEFVEIVEGNKTLKLTSWDLFPFKVHKNSDVMDLSQMDYLHLSIYQKGALDENNKPVSVCIWMNDKDNKVAQAPLLEVKQGEWTSVSFGMDYFKDKIDLSRVYVIRLKVGGYPTQDIFVDNIFAYKGEPITPGKVTDPYIDDKKEPIQDSTDGILPPMDQAYLGVNLASASGGSNPGVFGHDYLYPKFEDLYYFKAKGVRLLRIPFRAPRLQHEVGGELDYDADKSDIKALAAVVKEAERLGMWVMLDMHDYCERNIDGVLYEYGVAGRKVWNSSKNSWGDWEAMSEVILTKEHFADLWKKIATEFKDYTNIWGYALMNEPKGIDINILFDDYQAAINAIREVDTRAQIVIEGKNYAGAAGWESSSDKLKDLVDPVNKIVYQAHTYFDKTNKGTYDNSYDQEIGENVEVYKQRIDPFIAWLEKNNKKGMLGEYGVPYNGHAKGDERYMVLIDKVFAYLKEKQLTSTYWCGGAMYDAYTLTVQPAKDYYTEKSTMIVMEKYIKDFDNGVPSSVKTMDIAGNNTVVLYPNPVKDYLKVASEGGIEQVTVFNMIGQKVSEWNERGTSLELNLGILGKGTYLVTVRLEDGNVVNRKIVKM